MFSPVFYSFCYNQSSVEAAASQPMPQRNIDYTFAQSINLTAKCLQASLAQQPALTMFHWYHCVFIVCSLHLLVGSTQV